MKLIQILADFWRIDCHRADVVFNDKPFVARGLVLTYTFNSRKAVQATSELLKLEHGRRTNYMRLLKLLYIADRESIRDTGASITGDRIYAMERGPVLSNVLDLIKGEHIEAPEWSRSVHKDGYDVELADDPGIGALSRYEIRKLHEVSRRHALHDEWDLVDITHKLPEWMKNEPPKGSRNFIPVEDIVDAVGRMADKEMISREAEYARAANRLFGSPAK